MEPIKGQNILFTSAQFPFPLIGGERIKQYYLLKHLARENKIFLVCLDRNYRVTDSDMDELRKINIKPFLFHINPLKAYSSAAFFSPFGGPLEIEFFRNKGFKQQVDEILRKEKIDLIINFFLRTTEVVKNYKIKKILLAEDCRSFYQYGTSKVSDNFREKAIRFYDSLKLKKYEADIMNSFDVTTVVTEEDRYQMRELNSQSRIEILSNGVDTVKFCPPDINDYRKDLIFVGKLDCWTNILMVKRIVQEIFPGIKEKNPGIILHIVGASPVKEILVYQNESVLVHADVQDIVPHLQTAAIFLHPHIGGSGIQNKVLEAMACECPVITTPSGARGIKINPGVNGFITDNNTDIINIANELLNDNATINAVGKFARAHILKYHTWDSIYNDLEKIIHETLKSTQ